VWLAAGEHLAVRDVAGGQVGDLFAFNADDTREFLSDGHTRVAVRGLFPVVGQSFTTNRRRPILTLVEDTSPGIHDMLLAACDTERYRILGADPSHANCAANLRAAAAELGFEPVVIPQPVNLFMNTPALADGSIAWRAAESRAGDRVVLRAEMDVFVVVSACPMDIATVGINAEGPTDLELELVG